VIKFTYGFEALFEFLIVVQPALHLFDLLLTQADLTSTFARIGNRQNPERMPFATSALCATAAMADDAVDERAAEDLARDLQAIE
jgi:hypothetical protein